MREFNVIVKICERAERMGIESKDRITLLLDIENANKFCPIDLDGLLEADDMDFVHDICGIQRHINRTTKELEDLFVPRFALHID